MTKYLIISFTLLLIAVSILPACKKNDNTPPPDAESLLLNKTWKLVAFTISPAIDLGNGPTNDVLSAWDACDKDDLFIFKSNNVFIYDEGVLKCDAGYPQQLTSTWSYNKTTKEITYCIGNGSSCDSYTWVISEINDTQFKATAKESFQGTNYSYSVSFQKQ